MAPSARSARVQILQIPQIIIIGNAIVAAVILQLWTFSIKESASSVPPEQPTITQKKKAKKMDAKLSKLKDMGREITCTACGQKWRPDALKGDSCPNPKCGKTLIKEIEMELGR